MQTLNKKLIVAGKVLWSLPIARVWAQTLVATMMNRVVALHSNAASIQRIEGNYSLEIAGEIRQFLGCFDRAHHNLKGSSRWIGQPWRAIYFRLKRELLGAPWAA